MHIGVVSTALAAIDHELHGTDASAGSNLERLCSVMTDKPPSKTQQTNSKARVEAQNRMNPAFDSWLENKLHSIFDTVAAEPLPPDLLRLLETLDKKMTPPDDDKKTS